MARSAITNDVAIRAAAVSSREGGDSEVAALQKKQGGYVAVWSEGGTDIFLQLLTSNGTRTGSAVKVAAAAEGDGQLEPKVAALEGGGFAVVWRDGTAGIRARIYSADGTGQDEILQINDAPAPFQSEPDIAASPGGGFTVSWRGGDADDAGNKVEGGSLYLQRLDKDGTKIGTNLALTAQDGTDPHRGRIAALSEDGRTAGHVVTYHETSDKPSTHVTRIVQIDGTETTLKDQFSKAQSSGAAALADGRFVVAGSQEASSGAEVLARIYNSKGAAVGAEILVGAVPDSVSDLTVAASANGSSFVVAWTQKMGAGSEVVARTFDAAGRPLGHIFQLNRDANGLQTGPSLAIGSDGRLMATWDDRSAGGADTGLEARLFGPEVANLQRMAVREDAPAAKLFRPAPDFAGDDDTAITAKLVLNGAKAGALLGAGKAVKSDGKLIYTVKGSAEKVEAALDKVKFDSASNYFGKTSLDWSITDDAPGAQPTAQSGKIGIRVVGVNDRPDFVIPDSATISAKASFSRDLKARDADGDKLTYKLSGSDSSLFSIHDGHELTLKSPVGRGAYSVNIEVSDGHGGKDSMTFKLTVEGGIRRMQAEGSTFAVEGDAFASLAPDSSDPAVFSSSAADGRDDPGIFTWAVGRPDPLADDFLVV